ncbi:hypothetical protein I4U23_030291 [Adineta vaga]|nr:hypothetical protein I4U23_030291 [Adineta vaga]
MKQSFVRIFVILSLILSLASFILSLFALYLPNWKYIQLRSTYTPNVLSEDQTMDPLIRGELDKYISILYRRDETHSFGLTTHCIVGGECGQNYLPSFSETNYRLCHHINYHHQCIFSNLLIINNNTKCTCQTPSYAKIIHTFLILLISLEIFFFSINILRLSRQQCNTFCFNDSLLRLFSLLSLLTSFIFLIIILIQFNSNRLVEPLYLFDSMRQHYSRIQIYTFTKDLELIIQQIENSLDIHIGASYICILIVLALIIISFFTSVTVEMKISSTSSTLSMNDEDEKRTNSILIQPTLSERFVPSEQIRFVRQTKV